jgi:biopolymer transport protein ExbD
MADMMQSPETSQNGKVRSKKMSTRIDFTPMVDLGFLLITFFMLTTTLAKPQLMALVMPEDSGMERDPLPESKVLTIIPDARDKIFWYEGITDPVWDSTDYSAQGLRRVILDKMDRTNAQWGTETYQRRGEEMERQGSKLYVLIKPTEASRYKNVVDALDEMAVCGVRYYVLLATNEEEKATIRKLTHRI